NLHFYDLVRVADRAVAVRVALLDLVDELHAGLDLAPDRVFAIEGGRRREHDEELTVGAVWIGGSRHRHRPAHVLFAGEFGLELVAGAAGASTGRITCLRHEAVDNAVERHAVIKAAADEGLDL